MSPPAFDVRERPWIPVRINGRSLRVGLRELFLRAHEIEDLELPVPPSASGLLRVLYALTARIAADDDGQRMGDEDIEGVQEWAALRNRILAAGRFPPERVNGYFDAPALAGRFDLFGERPFLQDPRLAEQCPSSSGVNKLVLGRPTGVNGAVWFGHFTDTAPLPVPAAEAAWHMLAQLYYGPSGQCTPRRITTVKPGNGDAGPLRKTVSFHPWAPDLFTSLILGVPFSGEDSAAEEEDPCPWEQEEPGDPLGPLPPLTSPARLLTGRAKHAVLLVPGEHGATVTDAYITWSTHEPAQEAHDPYVVLNRSKDGRFYARPADCGRAAWRDLDALLLKSAEVHDFRRPRIFELLSALPAAVRDALRVRVYGFHQDGQQRDTGWYTATTPRVLRFLEEQDPQMAWRISTCRRAAEELGAQLDYAAKLAWAETVSPPKEGEKVRIDPKKPGPWAATATSAYWPGAEKLFWELTQPQSDATTIYRRFADLARAALRDAVGLAARNLPVARALNHALAVLRRAAPAQAPSVPAQTLRADDPRLPAAALETTQ